MPALQRLAFFAPFAVVAFVLTGCAQSGGELGHAFDDSVDAPEPVAAAPQHVAYRESSFNAPDRVVIGSLPAERYSYGEPRVYGGGYEAYPASAGYGDPYYYRDRYDYGYRSNGYWGYNSYGRQGYITVTPLQSGKIRR
jgi:hypothetical protein